MVCYFMSHVATKRARNASASVGVRQRQPAPRRVRTVYVRETPGPARYMPDTTSWPD